MCSAVSSCFPLGCLAGWAASQLAQPPRQPSGTTNNKCKKQETKTCGTIELFFAEMCFKKAQSWNIEESIKQNKVWGCCVCFEFCLHLAAWLSGQPASQLAQPASQAAKWPKPNKLKRYKKRQNIKLFWFSKRHRAGKSRNRKSENFSICVRFVRFVFHLAVWLASWVRWSRSL